MRRSSSGDQRQVSVGPKHASAVPTQTRTMWIRRILTPSHVLLAIAALLLAWAVCWSFHRPDRPIIDRTLKRGLPVHDEHQYPRLTEVPTRMSPGSRTTVIRIYPAWWLASTYYRAAVGIEVSPTGVPCIGTVIVSHHDRLLEGRFALLAWWRTSRIRSWLE